MPDKLKQFDKYLTAEDAIGIGGCTDGKCLKPEEPWGKKDDEVFERKFKYKKKHS